jgi:hypothetical protein
MGDRIATAASSVSLQIERLIAEARDVQQAERRVDLGQRVEIDLIRGQMGFDVFDPVLGEGIDHPLLCVGIAVDRGDAVFPQDRGVLLDDDRRLERRAGLA